MNLFYNRHVPYIKGHNIFSMFVKNKILLLIIYTKNKRIADMQNDDKENEKWHLKLSNLFSPIQF